MRDATSKAAIGLVSACLLLTAGAGTARAATELPWQVGPGRAELTPPLDVGILMSSGRGEWAPFEGVRLPIFARAVVIQQGPRRAAIVSLDLLGLAGEAVGGRPAFKQRGAAAAGGAIKPEELVLTSTHTHSGPESIALTGLQDTEPFKKWVDLLAQRIGAAVAAAAGTLRPCTLKTAVGTLPGLCVNRRILTEAGRIVSVRRVLPNDKVVGPEGPIDEEVRVAAMVDAAGRPAVVLVNATAHPVYEMCIKQVSPDYPGEMVREIQKHHPDTEVLFLQGAAGNINPPIVSSGATEAEKHGRLLAREVERLLGQLRPVAGNEMSLAWCEAKLPGRTVAGEPLDEPIAVPIGALRLGAAAWVFLPGEPFVEIALAIRKGSPFGFTAVAGYGDDYLGYIPTDRAFGHGGYETRPGRWSRFRPGSEEIVCREAGALLRSLAR